MLRLFKTAWFARFSEKESIENEMLWSVVERLERGLVDADLGGGVFKQRMSRSKTDRAKGLRVIILYRHGDKAFFMYGYLKSKLTNIRQDERAQFKEAAKWLLSLSNSQIELLKDRRQLNEVFRDA